MLKSNRKLISAKSSQDCRTHAKGSPATHIAAQTRKGRSAPNAGRLAAKKSGAAAPPVEIEKLAARIAAQFSRENEYELVSVVAADAVLAAELAKRIRDTAAGVRREEAISQLREVGSSYQAAVVLSEDPLGMTVGFRFSKGRFAGSPSNIFFLA